MEGLQGWQSMDLLRRTGFRQELTGKMTRRTYPDAVKGVCHLVARGPVLIVSVSLCHPDRGLGSGSPGANRERSKPSILAVGLFLLASMLAVGDDIDAPFEPFELTPDCPHLDTAAPPPALLEAAGGIESDAGSIGLDPQPVGSLTGRIVFTSAGHGWVYTSRWGLQRPILLEMNEDYGNLDQMTLFVDECFRAGATVVAFRPVGFQTNEVVLDNTSSGVVFAGAWANSVGSVYYGQAGRVPYRYANLAATETATAIYAPRIPAAGVYPVYTWVVASGNRTNQLYRIRHSGGHTLVRVPHHLVGNGWVYLGSYHFPAGADPARAAVVISNLGEPTGVGSAVVVADAIRFGNGMGNINRGSGVSGYPREEECARYWVQASLGQGQSASLYDGSGGDDSDNVGAPPRMAREMNREAGGRPRQRVYLGFHSNASGGSARGCIGLYNDETLFPDTATPNQRTLADLVAAQINTELKSLTLEVPWHTRASTTYARTDYAFGEINDASIQGEFDATMIEVAFHDNGDDARLLRDPRARSALARASCHALVRYMNQFDGAPLVFAPEPPTNPRAVAASQGIRVSWSPPVAQAGSGAPTGYILRQSTNGLGFGQPLGVPVATTSVLITNLPAAAPSYFHITATNAGGASRPSKVVGCLPPVSSLASRVLVVNAFDRLDRTLNLRQTPQAQVYRPPGHDANSGTIDRVLPGRANAGDYVVSYGRAIGAFGLPFDSCENEAVASGAVNLAPYRIVVWAAGNESSTSETISAAEQARLRAHLARGGCLFASGTHIAEDLDGGQGPTTADRAFVRECLHAAFLNADSESHRFAPVSPGLFAGLAGGLFDDGSQGLYCVDGADSITPVGTDARRGLMYSEHPQFCAAVVAEGTANLPGRVVFFAFPFETFVNEQRREEHFAAILRFFLPPPEIEMASLVPGAGLELGVLGEPGQVLTIEVSEGLAGWSPYATVPNPTGRLTWSDPDPPVAAPRFYRVGFP